MTRVRRALVAAAVLGTAVAAGLVSWPRLTAARPVAPAAIGMHELSCPASTRWPDHIPEQSDGDLGPAAATDAVLCTYALPHETQEYPLTDRTPLRGTPNNMIDYLNSLPPVPPSPLSNGMTTDMCPMMDTAVYVIVLRDADQDRSLQILPACGIVWADGAARRYGSLSKLLAYFTAR
jgi:hypothetical protein